jgi:hypothetical protein
MPVTTVPVVSTTDGPRVSVDDLLKNPRIIPRRILNLLYNQFIADQILRPGGDAPGGAVQFFAESPQFPQGPDAGIVNEFGEYPVVTYVEGVPLVAISQRRGFSMMISEDMRRRNQMDRVLLQMKQGTNLMIRTFNNLFQNQIIAAMNQPLAATGATGALATPGKLNAVNNTTAGQGPVVGPSFTGNTVVASNTWSTASGPTANTIRHDILECKRLVADQTVDGTASTAGTSYFGFKADTMLMSEHDSALIMESADFGTLYANSPGYAEQPLVRGEVPKRIFDLEVKISRSWPSGQIWIGEKGTFGFIATERPLQSTPMRYDEDREVWRNNTSRIIAIGIDQPLAGMLLTGIQ